MAFSPPVKGARSDGRLRIVDVGLKSIDFNRDSVISMLIWKDQADPANKKPKLSLFTGGDAEWDMEDSLGDWIDSKVEVLKTGHHGSLAGTSKEFVQKIKPDHVLLSAGNGHNHPGEIFTPHFEITCLNEIVPEWVLFYDAYYNALSGLSPPGKRIRTFSFS